MKVILAGEESLVMCGICALKEMNRLCTGFQLIDV